MDWNMLDDEDFRSEVRGFIEGHFPERLRNHPHRIPVWEETREWYLTLSEKGWLAPSWPQQYGGMGLAPEKLLIFTEEVERAGIPRLYDMGLFMLGPILIHHGSDEQKKTYLPKILSGEHRWAQGYSEPNAGSDLANLKTRADAVEGGFRINGHKTWSTFIDHATHMFLLARTGQGMKKQEGISFLLVDLSSEGVRRKLIRTIAGQEELGEVFFDDVFVPAKNLVGELNQGWKIAKDLLEFERINNGSPKQGLYALRLLSDFAEAEGLFDDMWFLERFTRLQLDLEDQMSAYRHFASRLKSGRKIGAEISLLKIWSTDTFKRISDLYIEIAGEQGTTVDIKGVETTGALRVFYNSRPATIYSGSSEVQREIVAKRILGLPNEKSGAISR
jgi:alkylation response protein AidB-like acyl-CoA dehydrogenase